MEDKVIQIFENGRFRVRGYLDRYGNVWLNVEDVARGLGFIEKEKISSTGDKYIRWERLNHYIAEIKARSESALIKSVSVPVYKNVYIPENLVYRLAMKANNETAEKFQALLADEILPLIRKHGLAFSVLIEKIVQAFIKGKFNCDLNPAMFCIYALEMSNGTVKIGKTTNFDNRAKAISNGSGLEILNSYHTEYVHHSVAAKIETACHNTFAAYRTRGEFFDIAFSEACDELDKYADIIAESNRELLRERIPSIRAEYEAYLATIHQFNPLF